MNNVSECTALNGYFIGTCFNGTSVFNMLKSINKGESLSLFNQDNKIWEITKNYDHKEFNNDESCLGYEISIFQETINKKIKEYLVNFDYLTRLLENYGFVLLDDSELKNINLNSSINSFEILYNKMIDSIKKNPSLINNLGKSNIMSSEEKKISFLNNYFIFKKIISYKNRQKTF